MAEIFINGEDHVLGRLASCVAKELKKGNTVWVANAEKVVISGSTDAVYRGYKEKVDRGDPYHGPFFPRRPDMVFKRTVRGMLPRQKSSGRDALRKLKVYNSMPSEMEGREFMALKAAENRLKCKQITLKRLEDKLGRSVKPGRPDG